jgi:transposase-like protein
MALASPPLLKKMRNFTTLKKKIEICERVLSARLNNTGDTLKGVARMENVAPSQIRQWLKW